MKKALVLTAFLALVSVAFVNAQCPSGGCGGKEKDPAKKEEPKK